MLGMRGACPSGFAPAALSHSSPERARARTGRAACCTSVAAAPRTAPERTYRDLVVVLGAPGAAPHGEERRAHSRARASMLRPRACRQRAASRSLRARERDVGSYNWAARSRSQVPRCWLQEATAAMRARLRGAIAARARADCCARVATSQVMSMQVLRRLARRSRRVFSGLGLFFCVVTRAWHPVAGGSRAL